MTQLDKVQLALRNRITDIGSGPSRRSCLAASVAADALNFDPRCDPIPVAVSAFPEEIYQAQKSWAEKAYPKLIYYN